MTLAAADIGALSRLLDQALELIPEQRDAWIASLPQTDRRLEPVLRQMLAEHLDSRTGAFMSSLPVVDAMVSARAGDAEPGELVGLYRLVHRIAAGGMGAVWLAERADGTFKRQVAIKLPHLASGVDLAGRMAREREIGALLEHPNIARLYDAGIDALGRPYLALEYIDGVTLDRWCKDRRPTLPERLKLFVQIARAVAYAHGRLVVHRDLKPSNVLVTRDGQAHLVDFGIARLLQESAGSDGATREHNLALTPRYASPEQFKGSAVTVASDVYSLGVMLYELLAGHSPYPEQMKSIAAVEEAIRQGAPPPPSRQADDRQGSKQLRGELDAIVAKALQRESGQRYTTAEAFADDIERHLGGQCVRALPDTVAYRLSKTLRRHRSAVAAVAAVAVAVVGSAGLSIVQAKRISESAARTEIVKEFVIDIFKVNSRGDPANSELRQLPAEVLLERGARLIDTKFRGQPQLQAELYGVVAGIFLDMGSAKLASTYATRQVEALTAIGARDAEQALALALLAASLAGEGRLADAVPRAQRAIVLARSDPVLRIQARLTLANIFFDQAEYESATQELAGVTVSLAEQPHPLSRALSKAAAETLFLQAALRHKRGDWSPDVARLLEKSIEEVISAEGPASRLAAKFRLFYSNHLSLLGRGAEAREQVNAAVAALRAAGGDEDIGAALTQSREFAQLFESGQIAHDDALAAVTNSQHLLSLPGTRVPEAVKAQVAFDLGWLNRRWGNVELAYTLQRDAVATLLPRAESPFAQLVLESSLGLDAMLIGRHDEADRLLRLALEHRKIDSGIKSENLIYNYIFIADNLRMQRRFDEAERVLNDAPLSGKSLSYARAEIELDRGNPSAAGQLLADPDAMDRYAEAPALKARVQCKGGDAKAGFAALQTILRELAAKRYEHDPEVAYLRAIAATCALAGEQPEAAKALARLARLSFEAQPGVSPYFKRPLVALEEKLAGR